MGFLRELQLLYNFKNIGTLFRIKFVARVHNRYHATFDKAPSAVQGVEVRALALDHHALDHLLGIFVILVDVMGFEACEQREREQRETSELPVGDTDRRFILLSTYPSTVQRSDYQLAKCPLAPRPYYRVRKLRAP
jgi:hypothetical protein